MTTPDPADKTLDAQADGAFGGKSDNHRAGYGGVEFNGREYTKLDWLLRAARRGDCLAWGDAAKVCAYYEALVEQAWRDGWDSAERWEKSAMFIELQRLRAL